MTVRDYVGAIGQTAELQLRQHADLTATVRIVDVTVAYGRVRYLVEPLAGTGRTWVESLRFPAEEET